jgi:hypothetical protein
MALVAGDIVTPLAFAGLLAPEAPVFGGYGVPIIGVVESVAGSNIKVDWEDGTIVTYADAGANTLTKVTVAADTTIYHKMVQILPGVIANEMGSSIGLVIGIFSVVGNDTAVVRFENGDVLIVGVAGLTIVETNPNITA